MPALQGDHLIRVPKGTGQEESPLPSPTSPQKVSLDEEWAPWPRTTLGECRGGGNCGVGVNSGGKAGRETERGAGQLAGQLKGLLLKPRD